MDIELINAFLMTEPSNEMERLVQINVQNLNNSLNKIMSQRNELLMAAKKNEEEMFKISGALENQMSMAEFLARQKGLQVLPQQSEKSPELSEQKV